MWQKQQHVRNHMTCAPFVKLVQWKKIESVASEFVEWNYNQVEFKERLSNEGDITLVRKFEKRASLSRMLLKRGIGNGEWEIENGKWEIEFLTLTFYNVE